MRKLLRSISRVSWLIALLVFIFAFALIMTRLRRTTEARWPTFSSHYTDANGLNALYRMLGENDLPVEQSYFSFTKSHAVQENIVLIAPKYRPYGRDLDSLIAQVSAGAWLFFIPENGSDYVKEMGFHQVPLQDDTYANEDLEEQQLNAIPLSPHPIISKLKNIVYHGQEGNYDFMNWRNRINRDFDYGITSHSAPLLPVLGVNKRIVAGWKNLGRGRIFIATHPYFLTNRGLQAGDNAKLALTLFQQMHQEHPAPIAFREYYQGFKRDVGSGVLSDGRVRAGLWLGLLTFLLWVYSQNGRVLRPVPVYAEPRRHVREFAASLATFYVRKGGTATLYEDVCHRFLNRLRVRLGLSAQDMKQSARIQAAAAAFWGAQAGQELENVLQSMQAAAQAPGVGTWVHAVSLIRHFSKEYQLDRHV